MCDTFVVVTPERVLFGKNSDRDPNEAQVLTWLPAGEHAAGSIVYSTWTTLPQARRTHAVLLSRPFWMWGAEMGANEHGVVIGNEAVFTDRPFDGDGLTGMDLVRLGLERGASASEACEVITALVRARGQGGRCGYSDPGFRYHGSFLIADHREAWVLETAGREVASERITAGVRAISNGLTLPVLAPRRDPLRSRVAQCDRRRSCVEARAASARTPHDAMEVLRDHGARGGPRYHWLNGAMGAPCVHAGGLVTGSQTVGAWISELCADGARHWATGTAAPCVNVFRPLSISRPRDTGKPTGAPDPSSLWWRGERLHRRALRRYGELPAALFDERRALEKASGDEDTAWAAADDWLARWSSRSPDGPDHRPAAARRAWQQAEEQAMEGSRLPWREPACPEAARRR